MANGTPNYSYEQLVEKVVRAKIQVQKIKRQEHKISCPVYDPESYAPCNCGASAHNKTIDDVIDELKL